VGSLNGMTAPHPDAPLHSATLHRTAETSVPIHSTHAERWSPRSFDEHAEISDETLAAALEAARWSPSAQNAQPWRFIVGRRGSAAHAAILDGLVASNRVWAAAASALIVNIAVTAKPDGTPLRWAEYDLGQAVAHLTLQAHHDGLHTHQMGGIEPAALAESFGLAAELVPVSVTALGVLGSPDALSERLRERELAPRTRMPLEELLLGGDRLQ
jgi:nitroreductase